MPQITEGESLAAPAGSADLKQVAHLCIMGRWRGVREADGAALEKRWGEIPPWVRIPPSPGSRSFALEVDMEELARWLTLIGSGIALQHRLSYGKWHDRGKAICHGKVGLVLAGLGLLCLLL